MGRRKRRLPQSLDPQSQIELSETCKQYDGRPKKEMSLVEEELMMQISDAFEARVLNTLSSRERQCFTDVMISNDKFRDVSKRYNISKGSVEKYIKRAAAKIRQFIEAKNG